MFYFQPENELEFYHLEASSKTLSVVDVEHKTCFTSAKHVFCLFHWLSEFKIAVQSVPFHNLIKS